MPNRPIAQAAMDHWRVAAALIAGVARDLSRPMTFERPAVSGMRRIVSAMNTTSRIGCAVCAELIGPDDEAIELLRTIEKDDPPVKGEPTTMQARPAYVHARCGVPAGDLEVRHDLMRGLRS